MKKLLFAALLAAGSFAVYASTQEPCTNEPCNEPCNQTEQCTPAPCDTVPCTPAPCNPGC